MSKKITIPADIGSRITVSINNTKYVYATGVEVTVPDEAAACIADMLANRPSGTRESATDEMLGDVADSISSLDERVTAAEGDIEGLDERVTALETPETPETPETTEP